MTLQEKLKGVYVDDSRINILGRVDSIVFDCDGVLIDVTQSYDKTIAKTARYILENFADIDDAIDEDFKIIDGFKSTGGFNDEVDLTYAAILSLAAARMLHRDQTGFIFDVIDNADSNGITTVERYIEGLVDISAIKQKLSYHPSSQIP